MLLGSGACPAARKKLEADPAHQSDKAEPLPGTVEEIDLFLNTTTVTADEATR